MTQVLADVSTSIGGAWGLEPMTVRAASSKHGTVNHRATPALLALHFLQSDWENINNALKQYLDKVKPKLETGCML